MDAHISASSSGCNDLDRVPSRSKLPAWVRSSALVITPNGQETAKVSGDDHAVTNANPPLAPLFEPSYSPEPPPTYILAGPKRDPFANVAVHSPMAALPSTSNYLVPAKGQPTPMIVRAVTSREMQLDGKAVAEACMAAVKDKFVPWPTFWQESAARRRASSPTPEPPRTICAVRERGRDSNDGIGVQAGNAGTEGDGRATAMKKTKAMVVMPANLVPAADLCGETLLQTPGPRHRAK